MHPFGNKVFTLRATLLDLRDTIPLMAFFILGPQSGFGVYRGFGWSLEWPQLELLQFDPEKKTLTHIGDGINFDLTPDKQWVLWVEGCWMDYVDRQLHFYELDTRKDYVLTSGHSDNKFDRWGAQEIDQNGELEKFIKAGKDYYLKGKFFPAIRKYQEAVQVDSKMPLFSSHLLPAQLLSYGSR